MTVTTPSICEEDAISAALRRELLAALLADLRDRQRRHGATLQFGRQLLRRVSNAVVPSTGRHASTDDISSRREAPAANVAGQLSVLVENVEALEWLFARLADGHSRTQFVELLKARITGQSSAGPIEQQRQLHQLAAVVNREFRLERRTYGSLLPDLVRYQIPGMSGPIDLRAREADLLTTFFIQRAAYDRDGTVIRARQGQVVIDAESRWGDTALYFADLVGRSGEVHAIEPDVRCVAVIRENCAQNPHLGYQTVVAVRGLSDRAGEWRSYPADGALQLLMRPESWERCMARTPTISIDEYVRQEAISRVDFIRLDVPAIAKALAGARGTICTYRPTVVVSCSPGLSDIVSLQPMLHEMGEHYDFFLDHLGCGDGIVLFARPHAPRPRG